MYVIKFENGTYLSIYEDITGDINRAKTFLSLQGAKSSLQLLQENAEYSKFCPAKTAYKCANSGRVVKVTLTEV